ncbi:hypothetical protein Chor_005625, partial [Crotalus horridus]
MSDLSSPCSYSCDAMVIPINTVVCILQLAKQLQSLGKAGIQDSVFDTGN